MCVSSVSIGSGTARRPPEILPGRNLIAADVAPHWRPHSPFVGASIRGRGLRRCYRCLDGVAVTGVDTDSIPGSDSRPLARQGTVAAALRLM